MFYSNCPECREIVALTKKGGFMIHYHGGAINECFGSGHYPKGIFDMAKAIVNAFTVRVMKERVNARAKNN